MNIHILGPYYVYPETLALFYTRTFESLGHTVFGFDPRVGRYWGTSCKPELIVVVKGFEFTRGQIEGLKREHECRAVLIFPDETGHEDYGEVLARIIDAYDDVFFCMKHSEEVMERYNARFLPFGYCSGIHCPMNCEKEYNVIFIGSYRGGREFIPRVPGVKIYGNGWGSDIKDIYLEAKSTEHSKAKIVLNHHYLGIGPNMRFFEVLGTCAFLMTDVVDGMEELGFQEGVHYVSYDGFDDLLEKIRYYVDRSVERERIARQGYEFVKISHTYVDRARRLLEICGF